MFLFVVWFNFYFIAMNEQNEWTKWIKTEHGKNQWQIKNSNKFGQNAIWYIIYLMYSMYTVYRKK